MAIKLKNCKQPYMMFFLVLCSFKFYLFSISHEVSCSLSEQLFSLYFFMKSVFFSGVSSSNHSLYAKYVSSYFLTYSSAEIRQVLSSDCIARQCGTTQQYSNLLVKRTTKQITTRSICCFYWSVLLVSMFLYYTIDSQHRYTVIII